MWCKLKIKKLNFKNKEVVQIYVNKKELKNEKNMQEIDNIKNQNSNVFIIISGENDTIKTFKEMLNYEKSKN